ncbi:MAG: prepilin-type N-terminal cleavage/methylation domain-containing protein [Oscillospiraceae bacterium]|nr:prepilin-type N-terminal cleavage/methylation domain-containing protein [Oscillospiraceae bacterium]
MLKRLQAMRAKKGFTLVELIVVIVIIAILAAILIPILVNHVRNSRCSAAIGDCKTAHNIAADWVADQFAQGKTPTNGDLQTYLGSNPTGYNSDVTVTFTPASGAGTFDTIVAEGTAGTALENHEFPEPSTGKCTNPKCVQHI